MTTKELYQENGRGHVWERMHPESWVIVSNNNNPHQSAYIAECAAREKSFLDLCTRRKLALALSRARARALARALARIQAHALRGKK